MPNVLVGSVTAELLLDTTKFSKSLADVESKVKGLNTAFRGTDARKMAEDITKLEEQLKKSTEMITKQAETIEQLKKSYDSAQAEIDNLISQTEKLGAESQKQVEVNNEITKSNENLGKSYDTLKTKKRSLDTVLKDKNILGNLAKEFKNGVTNLDWGLFENKFLKVINQGFRADGSQFIRGLEPVTAKARAEFQALIDLMLRFRELGQTASDGAKGVLNFHEALNKIAMDEARVKTETENIRNGFILLDEIVAKAEARIKLFNQAFAQLSTPNAISSFVQQISSFGGAIDSFGKRFSIEVKGITKYVTDWTQSFDKLAFLLGEEYVNAVNKWSEASGKVTSGMSRFAQTTETMRASLQKTYDALSNAGAFFKRFDEQINISQQSLKRFGTTSPNLETFKTHLNEVYELMGRFGIVYEESDYGSRRWAESIRSASVTLQDYYKNMNQVIQKTRELQTAMATKISAGGTINNASGQLSTQLGHTSRQLELTQKLKEGNNTLYESTRRNREALMALKAEADKTSVSTNKLGDSTQKASSKMNSMSGATKKLQGAMSTLKMTTSMLSSMFIWTFGMSLWEATKQTVQSKNEMESYLNQMHMGKGSISIFNRGLDETVDKFKKLNKYMIGETIASIGMEFDLTANQMAKSMDVVAMIQNEYVRAGRKESEASLAVKDILQGEFLRLSRETGVGKQDLIDTGLWQGDLKDVEGLMEALRKVGTDRHWDLFASKCNSLNDVVSTTKNRISEFTATLIDQVSPLIIEGFNGIIGVVDFFTDSWNNMGGTMQMLVGGGVFTAVTSAILMIGKNMGLVQIATNGFTNSLASMILKMDASQVKSQGLIKSITMAITGFNAETNAGLGTVKMLATRILGLDANVVATHGFAKAITVAKQGLVGERAMAEASNLTHVKMSTVIKETVVSWKMLKVAILGVMALGIVAFLGMVAQQCERAKRAVDTFYEVVDNGKEIVEDSQKTVDKYNNQLGSLEERMNKAGAGTKTYIRLQKEYNQTLHNRNQAITNLKNNQLAYDKAQQYNNDQQQRWNNIQLEQQDRLTKVYENQGLASDKASEKASKYLSEVEMGNRLINESYDAYENSIRTATGHANAHAEALKNVNANEEQRNKYIEDYMNESYKVAEYWKEFYQGDFWALFKIALGEITKYWIDLSSHPEFVKFMNELNDTFREMKPYLDAIWQGLQWLGMELVKLASWLLSNPIGRSVAGWSALGLVIGGVGLKIASILTGGKGVIDIFKTIGGKIPNLIDKFKNLGKTAEETGTILGGGSSKDKKSGGKGKKDKGGMGGQYDMGKTRKGKNSPVYTDWSETSFGEVAKSDFLDNSRNFLKLTEQLAFAMVLVTEAILLLTLPMGALAVTGEVFKNLEPQIKKGAEGLMTIAPVMAILLPPIVACMVIMEKFGDSLSTTGIAKAGLKVAEGIAIALGLVAEAIILLSAPLLAIAGLGALYGWLGEGNINQGIKAIDMTTQALTMLAPWIPVFIAGVVLMAVATTGVGAIAIGVVAGGIGLAMLLVAEAVVTLAIPLEAVKEIGEKYTDLSGVEQGAEAIKQTGLALKYLDDACSSMAGITWDNLSMWLASGGKNMSEIADELGKEDGIIPKLNEFADKFSQFEFTPIDEGKVENFKTLAEGVNKVSEAINTVKGALANFGNTQTPAQQYATATGNAQDSGFTVIEEIQTEFQNMTTVITELSTFADNVNELTISSIDEGIINAIITTANTVSQVKTAVDTVKGVMGGIVDSNWASNMASGGIVGAISGFLGGNGATGGYVSSFGSSLQSLENAVKDIMHFNSQIQGIVGTNNSSEGGDATGTIESAVNVVQQISNVISQIKTTLSSGIGEIESTAKNVGKSIVNGISSGITENLSSVSGTVREAGKGLGKSMADGFKTGIDPMSSYMNQEMTYIGNAIDGKHDGLVQKAGQLAKDMTKAYKDNLDMNSPGLMARLTNQEMGFINTAIEENTDPIIQNIGSLAQQMTENFEPSLETQVNVDFTAGNVLDEYQSDSVMAMGLANETVTTTENAFTQLDLNTGLTFSSIGNTIGTTMTNIANTTRLNYTNVANTTKTQLNNMQSQTTKNIGQIKQSWAGMQTALIQSAEHIRSETGAKIHSLQNNMATFWRKVQNPALLLGAGNESEGKGSNRVRYGSHGSHVTKVLRPKGLSGSTGFAGSPNIRRSNSNPRGARTGTGISDIFKFGNGKTEQLDMLVEYLQCLQSGKPCYAGGWDFNWSDDIKKALLTWHTHFGEIYDPYLYVGKFENDTFPVRGIAPIALRYIQDAIGRTNYEFYYNERYAPLEAWNRGSFNCMDGARLVIALASAFGFGGGYYGHTTWDGIPHIYAIIPNLGVIDATAIQGHYGLTAGKVSYGAGGDSAKPVFKHNRVPSKSSDKSIGDVNINITFNGDVTDESIGDRIGRRVREEIIDLVNPNPTTGM